MCTRMLLLLLLLGMSESFAAKKIHKMSLDADETEFEAILDEDINESKRLSDVDEDLEAYFDEERMPDLIEESEIQKQAIAKKIKKAANDPEAKAIAEINDVEKNEAMAVFAPKTPSKNDKAAQIAETSQLKVDDIAKATTAKDFSDVNSELVGKDEDEIEANPNAFNIPDAESVNGSAPLFK